MMYSNDLNYRRYDELRISVFNLSIFRLCIFRLLLIPGGS